MKKLNRRPLRSRKGETLLETVISFLLLAVLLMGVSFMTETALRITRASTDSARATQQEVVNPLLRRDAGRFAPGATVEFSFPGTGLEKVSHPVRLYQDNGLIAFIPDPDEGTP